MKSLVLITLMMLFALFSCNDKNMNQPDPMSFTSDFEADSDGWVGDFADYPAGEESFYELTFERDTLPGPLEQNQWALKLSGNNHSDDLFMFVKKKVTGLEPNTVYYTTFTVEFASNVPDGMAGVGGSPGESVYIKVGGAPLEPKKMIEDNNHYRMNIDKANQSEDGENMKVIGDFSNDTEEAVYTLKTVTNENPFGITTDENGTLWVIVGTESGFEATTTIYYNSVTVEFY